MSVCCSPLDKLCISRIFLNIWESDRILCFLSATGDRSSEQSTLIRIGEIYEQQGQYEQALEFYHQALTLNRKPSTPFRKINTFMSLSRVYQKLGQYEQALESYQQALAAGRSVGNNYFKYIQEPYILMSLSQVDRQLGQDKQAREFYQQDRIILDCLWVFYSEFLALNPSLERNNYYP